MWDRTIDNGGRDWSGIERRKSRQNRIRINGLPDTEEMPDIGEMVTVLWAHKWLIGTVMVVTLAIATTYIYLKTPEYQADALLQVDEKASGLSELEDVQPQTSPIQVELEILRSRSILGKVVDKLKLDYVAQPLFFPIIGEALARSFTGPGLAKPVFGLGAYAWGGEQIRVSQLEVPGKFVGKPLRVQSIDDRTYLVQDIGGTWQHKGTIGELLRFSVPGEGDFLLHISMLNARPGTWFEAERKPRLKAIADLADYLTVSERGGRGSGVAQVTLTGIDSNALPVILNEIMHVYITQNVNRRSAEAESTMAFLDKQLPLLKERLYVSERDYDNYRMKQGSIDLNGETKSLLDQVVQYDDELVQLKQQREDLRQRFKPEHPKLRALTAKTRRLNAERAELHRQVEKLPEFQQKLLRLKRDVDTNALLYTSLLNTAQELRLAKAGVAGNIRVIDEAAVGMYPVKPKKNLILAVAAVGGTVFGLLVVWVKRNWRTTVDDADAVEGMFSLPVLSTVPHSKRQEEAERQRVGTTNVCALALESDTDGSIESLRNLRTTLRFIVKESQRPGVLITEPMPGSGKTFVVANLVVLLAQAGETVVLVEGDMRQGRLHSRFNVAEVPGLSDYLSGSCAIDDVVQSSDVEGLSIIGGGSVRHRASELLMNGRLGELIAELSKTFKYVILNAPPVLPVADAALIGHFTSATVVVARAGKTQVRELQEVIKRLVLSDVQVSGLVLNDADPMLLRYRYG